MCLKLKAQGVKLKVIGQHVQIVWISDVFDRMALSFAFYALCFKLTFALPINGDLENEAKNHQIL